jgi:hypothetical protein
MKVSSIIGPFAFVIGLGIPVSTALSSETPSPPEQHRLGMEQQAVVIKVESDTVTLRSLTDDKKIIIISRKDAGTLQAGDRVVLDGEKVRKVEPTLKPDPAGEASNTEETSSRPTEAPPTSTGSSGTDDVLQKK